MLKASALYIVIIIALVIGITCSALIAAAYFYQAQYQLKFRHDRLQNNMDSGIHILLNNQDTSYQLPQRLSLFGNGSDSAMLQKYPWGAFDIGMVKTFDHRDTMLRMFSIASTVDSASWPVVYLIDEDRPLSLSGKTSLVGDARLPKAGVKTAYVDNQSYNGDEQLVKGHIRDSERQLPQLSGERLELIARLFRQPLTATQGLSRQAETTRSFKSPTWVIRLDKEAVMLQNTRLSGNIILYSDTTVTIDNTASLRNVIVVARAISVKSGFRGNCQLYATDSLSVGQDCHFSYPSCLGIFRDSSSAIGLPEKLSLGENSSCEGLVFTYEKQQSKLPAVISLSKHVLISGQVYSQGILSLKEGVSILGGTMTSRFLYQNGFTAYENYLINVRMDAKALSPYYLSSPLSPSAGGPQRILQWLE
ncbi:hypothetical protein SNE25_10025 [Mucilaginibacter sabulilitoris]|uniref:Uncharacterized protein n=1 Tax=Mucilaginibacter sabulilitoris TaxID=1173583 RepID=A0ABZ0TVN0_9SPHI|nr:hypothetical protein [Mucilaginibacter sabulilitoris]WPU95854.1 hypothetical protein SNE25_10025 [Mucilaginibacter sabulilitoris]